MGQPADQIAAPKRYSAIFPLVDAVQFNGNHPQVVRCTQCGDKLTPAPAGLEVLGGTVWGLKTGDKTAEPIKKGDWIVYFRSTDQLAILSDEVFRSTYKEAGPLLQSM